MDSSSVVDKVDSREVVACSIDTCFLVNVLSKRYWWGGGADGMVCENSHLQKRQKK